MKMRTADSDDMDEDDKPDWMIKFKRERESERVREKERESGNLSSIQKKFPARYQELP